MNKIIEKEKKITQFNLVIIIIIRYNYTITKVFNYSLLNYSLGSMITQ